MELSAKRRQKHTRTWAAIHFCYLCQKVEQVTNLPVVKQYEYLTKVILIMCLQYLQFNLKSTIDIFYFCFHSIGCSRSVQCGVYFVSELLQHEWIKTNIYRNHLQKVPECRSLPHPSPYNPSVAVQQSITSTRANPLCRYTMYVWMGPLCRMARCAADSCDNIQQNTDKNWVQIDRLIERGAAYHCRMQMRLIRAWLLSSLLLRLPRSKSSMCRFI